MQNTRWKIHSGFEELKPLLFDIQAHFSESDSFIHDARNKLKTIKHNGLDIVVKSFKVPNLLNQFAYAYLRDSKAKKSYVNALKLEKLHITTPAIQYLVRHMADTADNRRCQEGPKYVDVLLVLAFLSQMKQRTDCYCRNWNQNGQNEQYSLQERICFSEESSLIFLMILPDHFGIGKNH